MIELISLIIIVNWGTEYSEFEGMFKREVTWGLTPFFVPKQL